MRVYKSFLNRRIPRQKYGMQSLVYVVAKIWILVLNEIKESAALEIF